MSTEQGASLAAHLRAVRDSERASFHMPGHKGGDGAPTEARELLGADAYASDLSELGGFDYLHHPRSALREAAARAAEVFGADRTWFLVNGATVGNLAAVDALACDGGALVLARGSHRSVYGGLEISGARPVYLPALKSAALDGLFGIDLDALRWALSTTRDVQAVHVTSPNYYGMTIDVAQVVEIAHAWGVPVIVDEAHGTHFSFHPEFPATALACGADIVVHSPHKTIGALTQASLLHHQGSLVDPSRLDARLQVLQSSSPSALLLVSLDAAIHDMADGGFASWGRALDLAAEVRDGLASVQGIRAYGSEVTREPGIAGFDPTKVIVDVHELGITGLAAAAWLRAHHGLNPEFADLRRMVFSISAADTTESAAVLVVALRSLAQSVPRGDLGSPIVSLLPTSVPEIVLTPDVAIHAKYADVPSDVAVGMVAAEMIVPYPPGLPLIVPGERVTAEILAAAQQLRAAGCALVGMADPTGASIRCATSFAVPSARVAMDEAGDGIGGAGAVGVNRLRGDTQPTA